MLVYAHGMNGLGDIIDIIKKNIETVIAASKEVGPAVNAEYFKCILLARH
jgi:ketol-acid reductoisomerase